MSSPPSAAEGLVAWAPRMSDSASASGQARRLARADFWEAAKPMTPFVALERPDGVFLLPTSIDPKLFIEGSRGEFVVLPRARKALLQAGRLPEGGTLVDVGAHVGTTTIPAVRAHGFEAVVAIEPDPDVLVLLRTNLELNGVADRVTVVDAAVAGTEGEAAFRPGTRTEYVHRWMKGQLVSEPSAETMPVRTVTLDGLVGEGVVDPAAAGLLWFDCAGREEDALRSAELFLARRVPIIFTLRRSAIVRGSQLVELLASVYEFAVDLRHPSLGSDVSAWTPAFRPAGELQDLRIRGKLTDMLVF
jgi:FkbM family methyltransferase